MSKQTSTHVVTPEFRVSYPNVFKAQRNKLSGKDEYSVQALFKKGQDIQKLKDAAKAAATAKWGEDTSKWPKNLRLPFRDQKELERDGKQPDGTEPGAIFMRFKSERRPGVVDQNVQEIIEDSKFYAGCYAIASVNAYAYDQAGNRGVSFGLNHLQFVKDGEPFSGRPKVEDAFAPIETEGGAETSSTSATDLF